MIGNMTTILASLGVAASTGRSATDCNTAGVDPIDGEITTTLGYLDTMVDKLSCSNINSMIQKSVYVYVCDDLINGIWATWAIQCAASALLYLALVVFPCATNQSADVLDITFGKVLWEDMEDEVEKAEREAEEAEAKRSAEEAEKIKQEADAEARRADCFVPTAHWHSA